MCFETSITYACGHWETVVTPCGFRGTARCWLCRLSPKILTWYCSPACPGVSVWPPPRQFGWKLVTSRTPPVSRYPFTSFEQPPPPMPIHNMAAEQNASSLYAQNPNISTSGRQPHNTPTRDVSNLPRAPHIHSTSNLTFGTGTSASSRGMTDQCLITRWQPFQPMFYRGTPSKVAGAKKGAESPAYQEAFPSPYRPRVPEARMYEDGQQPLPDVVSQNSQYYVKAAKEFNGGKGSNSRAASMSYAACMVNGCSSNTSETLISGDDNEDNSDGAGYGMSSSDGVIDTRTTACYNGYYNNIAAGVDVANSLHIDKEGRFHLGSQWQVPSSNSARSKAGPRFGKASVWSEWWSEPAWNGTASAELDTMFPDEVMSDRMQTLDLANLHRPHTGPGDDPMREDTRDYESQATPAPLTAALNCHNYSRSETEDSDDCVVINRGSSGGFGGEGSRNHRDYRQYQATPATPAATGSYYGGFETDDDGCFTLKEAPNTVDLSMRGAH